MPFSNLDELLKWFPTVTSGNCVSFFSSTKKCHSLQHSSCIDPCVLFSPSGGVEHHWNGAGHEQVHRLSPVAPADPLCCSLCWYWALHTADWLHAADHLPAVQRPLTHQSSEGCYRGVSSGYLQVSPAEALFFSRSCKMSSFQTVLGSNSQS